MGQIRVLQVIGSMNRAGAETIVMNLMRAIDRERVQFDFLVHTRKPCDYDDEIRALGGRIFRVPRYNIVNEPVYRAECRKLLESHPEITVVHGHIGSSSAIYLDEAAKAGCATVVHSHRDSPKAKTPAAIARRALYGALIRKVPDIADEFLACGYQAGVDRFGVGVAGGAHFHVMRNGIDVDRYACDEAGHLRAKEALGYADVPLVGDVARLVPEKNQEFLLEVFARTLRRHPDARLLVVGRGPQDQVLKDKARDLGIQSSVDFLGVRDDVPEILKALDAFVFPSKLEGLGMAVVEAQAAGAPCIVSTAVPAEAIATSLVERIPTSLGPDEWAARLDALLDAPAPRTPHDAEIRAHGYDIADVAAWMCRFYERLSAQSPRARAMAAAGAACGDAARCADGSHAGAGRTGEVVR